VAFIGEGSRPRDPLFAEVDVFVDIDANPQKKQNKRYIEIKRCNIRFSGYHDDHGMALKRGGDSRGDR
jgi:hypothetical protein